MRSYQFILATLGTALATTNCTGPGEELNHALGCYNETAPIEDTCCDPTNIWCLFHNPVIYVGSGVVAGICLIAMVQPLLSPIVVSAEPETQPQSKTAVKPADPTEWLIHEKNSKQTISAFFGDETTDLMTSNNRQTDYGSTSTAKTTGELMRDVEAPLSSETSKPFSPTRSYS